MNPPDKKEISEVASIVHGGRTFTLEGRIDDSITQFHLNSGQFYELDSLIYLSNLLNRFDNEEMVILDAGANIGNHTLFFSSQIEDSHLVAFEMNPETFEYLRDNVERNSLKNVTIVNNGLSNEERQCAIIERTRDPLGGAQVDLSRDGSVQLTTIDKFFENFEPAGPVRLLKLDVEGHELQCLNGAKEFLRRERPLIFLECKEEKECEVLFRLMEDLDFEAVWTAEGWLPNFLFAPTEMINTLFSQEERYLFRKDLCFRHVEAWQLIRKIKTMQTELDELKS